MTYIKKIGWVGVVLAVFAFSVGFCAGAVYRNGAAPAAHSSAPPAAIEAPQQPPVSATEFTKLAEAVSGLRAEMTEMNATLARIEAALRKR